MADKSDGASLPPAYFDSVYAANPDPWNFSGSEYERARYADTLENLPKVRYRNALEIGCSIGVFTGQLATRCEALLSVDVSESALRQARERCNHLSNVRFDRLQIPQQHPQGSFDLIVVSEVAYYWSVSDLDRAILGFAANQHAGDTLLLVHWTPEVHDYPLTGDTVHDTWLARTEWRCVCDLRRTSYRLSVLERAIQGRLSP